MNHDEAIRVMASEKYLLDELAPEARNQFEDHLFGCQECALDVRAGAAFIAQASHVLGAAEQPRLAPTVSPVKPSWWTAFLRPAIAVPAMAVLLAMIGYQALVEIPRLNRELAASNVPQLLASTSLINVNSRGASKASVSVKHGEPFLLFVDVAAESRFSSYTAELHDAKGTLHWSLPVSAGMARDTLSLRIPSDQLEAGSYTLIVRGVSSGQPGSDIGHYPFQLEFQSR